MITKHRFWLMRALSLVFFALLLTRLGYLQICCHASLAQRAEREHALRLVEPSPRGAILDRAGRVLAMSLEGGSCFADPHEVKNAKETARILSPLLQVPASELQSKFSQHKRFVWLARRLDPATTQRLQEIHCPGVRVVSEMKRFYPEESLAAHVLGVIGDTQEGLSGVEQMTDPWLSGRSQDTLFKEWTFGNTVALPGNQKSELPPRSIVLTIDRTLQYIVEQELAVQMALSRPRRGTVIVEDPNTGEILAMATAPGFNPNFWGGPHGSRGDGPEKLKNPAIENVFEPGSTFKLVAAAAALEDHVAGPQERFYCENGVWEIQGRTIHDHEPENWLTFTEVISHSSNIGTAKIALRLGQDRMYRYARAFGFGMSTGIGLPGDGAGILRNPHQWRNGSLATIAFGQEVGVTPLQMVNAYTVVADGGMLLEPRLYNGFVDAQGNYFEWEKSKPIRRVISAKTVALLRSILKEVVDHGTGKAAQVAGISIAGKTGTAQKIDPSTRQYSPDKYLASFCGFAPVDHPRLVIGIFLDEPQRSYWGGSEAAPLFARILRDAAPYLHLDSPSVGPFAFSRTISRS